MYSYIYNYVCMYKFCICMNVCICIIMCVFMYIHTCLLMEMICIMWWSRVSRQVGTQSCYALLLAMYVSVAATNSSLLAAIFLLLLVNRPCVRG